MDNNVTKKIIETIKKRRIFPQAKWKIRVKSYLFWIIWGFMVLLGALFLSLILQNVLDIDMDWFHHMKLMMIIRIIIVTAPFLWIVLAILSLVFGLFAFKKTKHGYRYSLLFVTTIVVLIVSILGVMAHIVRISDRFEKQFSQDQRFHRFIPRPEDRWQRPGDGLLVGKIQQVTGETISLLSVEGESWQVHFSEKTERDQQLELKEGNIIMIIGERIDDATFEAKVIKQPRPGRKIFFKMAPPPPPQGL